MPLFDHDKAFDEWWSKNRLPVEKGTLRRGWRLGAETERARIRRELLAEIEDIREHEEYTSCVDGSERERWVVERESLFASLDRVCPEEK